MLENIKSRYIFRIIIFHLSVKKKLILIKYNKKLQTRLNIKILNYKIFSGKSITNYDKDKKGKIYKIYDEYKDKLIFEGEFLNGQKNGKGIEYYDDGKLKYKGEYHNGYRNGKGKEYYKNRIFKWKNNFWNIIL